MKIKAYSSGILFRTAVQAFERISFEKDKLGSALNDVLVTILFSASALEAYINELGELAISLYSSQYGDETLQQFINVMNELEKGKESTRLKYQLAKFILTKQSYDKGKQPYQDLDLLFRLRNNIVHLKPIEITDKPEKIVKALISKKILVDDHSNIKVSWISQISKRTVAKWAINSSIDIIMDLKKSVLGSTLTNNEVKIILSEHFMLVEKVN